MVTRRLPPTVQDYRRAVDKSFGSGGSSKFRSNKPPHPRLGRPTPWGGIVERGAIFSNVAGATDPSKSRGVFYFHFNPETFSINYSAVDIDIYAQEEAGEGAGLPGSKTMSFDMLLNRQYDVLYNPNSTGTLHDIEVLIHVLGNGKMLQNEKNVQVQFGRRTAIEGYASNMSVQHHQFTSRMIPVWTTVSLTLVDLPLAVDVGGERAPIPGKSYFDNLYGGKGVRGGFEQ